MNDTILLRKIHQNNEKISEYCYGPNFPNISSAYYTETKQRIQFYYII